MNVTKTRQAANQIGHNGYMFNDRMLDGRRSLKVPDWGKLQYEACAELLREQGCIVKIVVRKTNCGWPRRKCTVMRLHVTE